MSNIKELIKVLSSRYKPEEKIIVAWWDKEWFEQVLDRKLNNQEWEEVLDECEKVMEYTNLGDLLMIEAERALDEYSKELKDKKERDKSNE